jgi:hypothetical protein
MKKQNLIYYSEHLTKLPIQCSPTNYGTICFEEFFVNQWQSFIVHSQVSKWMQPSDSALNHPARLSQTATVRCTALRQLRADAAYYHYFAM